MHDDDELTPEEREAFARLPKTETPSAAFEDRVVDALRGRGEIGRSRATSPRMWYAAATILIAIGSFALGRSTAPAAATVAAISTGTSPSTTPPSGTREFLLLLYGAGATSPADERARYIEYGNWARAESSAGRVITGERLGPQSAAVGNARYVPAFDGQPSGFFIVRAASFEEASRLAQTCPHVRHGGAVIVRALE